MDSSPSAFRQPLQPFLEPLHGNPLSQEALPEIRLYGMPHSPWVQIVMLTLESKKLPYSLSLIPSWQIWRTNGHVIPTMAYTEICPAQDVNAVGDANVNDAVEGAKALTFRTTVVADSFRIMCFLDEKHSDRGWPLRMPLGKEDPGGNAVLEYQGALEELFLELAMERVDSFCKFIWKFPLAFSRSRSWEVSELSSDMSSGNTGEAKRPLNYSSSSSPSISQTTAAVISVKSAFGLFSIVMKWISFITKRILSRIFVGIAGADFGSTLGSLNAGVRLTGAFEIHDAKRMEWLLDSWETMLVENKEFREKFHTTEAACANADSETMIPVSETDESAREIFLRPPPTYRDLGLYGILQMGSSGLSEKKLRLTIERKKLRNFIVEMNEIWFPNYKQNFCSRVSRNTISANSICLNSSGVVPASFFETCLSLSTFAFLWSPLGLPMLGLVKTAFFIKSRCNQDRSGRRISKKSRWFRETFGKLPLVNHML